MMKMALFAYDRGYAIWEIPNWPEDLKFGKNILRIKFEGRIEINIFQNPCVQPSMMIHKRSLRNLKSPGQLGISKNVGKIYI